MTRVERALAYAAAAVLVAMLVGAVNIPAHAVSRTPRVGVSDQFKTAREPIAFEMLRCSGQADACSALIVGGFSEPERACITLAR